MISDQLIDGKIMLSDLIAHAVAIGVRAGRDQIHYSGAWPMAASILNEDPELLKHRERIINLRNTVKGTK